LRARIAHLLLLLPLFCVTTYLILPWHFDFNHQFPKSVCTSVNEVICHGIPDNRPLEDGDIVNIDVSTFINGYVYRRRV